MRFITRAIDKLQRHPKRVVFPEGEEPRVLQAARQFHALRLGAPILLGDPAKIKVAADELKVSLDGIRVLNPESSEELENFVRRLVALRRDKGMRPEDARAALVQPNYFGAMMLAMRQADALVSGASHQTGSVLRPLFQIIKVAPQNRVASSCMIMEVEDTRIGHNGVLFMADCGVVPDPTAEQLAEIAVATAQLARHLLNTKPRVAMLSFSTKGNASHASIGKMKAATALAELRAKEKFLEAEFDGEMQADTALVPEVASRKTHDPKVAGHANVLIFPDLNSGNIASKLMRVVGKANAYGQILLGLNRPAADVSRGSTAHDVLGVAAVVGLQANDFHELYPDAVAGLPGE